MRHLGVGLIACLGTAGCEGAPTGPRSAGPVTETDGSSGELESPGGGSQAEESEDTGVLDGYASPAWDDPPFRGGSRLDVVVVDVGPGLYLRHHDRWLGLDCAPTRALDGVVRCMPERGAFEVRYVDAVCSDPVYRLREDSCVTTRIWRDRVSEGAFCLLPERVTDWHLAPVQPDSLYAAYGTGCTHDDEVSLVGWGAYYALEDAPIDPRAYVALVQEDVVGPGGLGRRWWLGEDGSRAAIGVVDQGGEVRPWQADGVVRALPAPVVQRTDERYFAVETCDGAPAALDRTSSQCPTPRTILRAEAGQLAPSEVVGVHPAAWEKSGPICRPVHSRGRFVEAAAPGAWSDWPELTPVRVGGVGLGLAGWTDDGGVWLAPVSRGPIVDDEGAAWEVTGRQGGLVARAPVETLEVEGLDYYADAACTVPVFDVSRQGDARLAVSRGEPACETPDGLPPVLEAWSLSEPLYEEPLYRVGPNGLCVEPALVFPSERRRGEPVALDEAVPTLPVRRIGR